RLARSRLLRGSARSLLLRSLASPRGSASLGCASLEVASCAAPLAHFFLNGSLRSVFFSGAGGGGGAGAGAGAGGGGAASDGMTGLATGGGFLSRERCSCPRSRLRDASDAARAGLGGSGAATAAAGSGFGGSGLGAATAAGSGFGGSGF